MNDILKSCTLCPRECKVNRYEHKGFCGETAKVRIARAELHMWEEPCISGTEGSGTVFFSGCCLKCCFCQNYEISAEGKGFMLTEQELADTFLRLQSRGANNINLSISAKQTKTTVFTVVFFCIHDFYTIVFNIFTARSSSRG